LQARIALAVIALALLGAGPAAGATLVDQLTGFAVDQNTGSLQSGKLHPTGTASTCNSPKTMPASDPGTFLETGVGEISFINEPACLTIQYSTTDATCQANGLFSAAYRGVDFGYLGDVGSAPTDATPVSYSVVAPANAETDVFFNMSAENTECPSFDATITTDRPWLNFQQPLKGHPLVGETLTTFNDSRYWAGATAVSNQWRRCAADGTACEDIPGATADTYVPVPDDVGHTLVVRATATGATATSTADSLAVLVGVQLDAAGDQAVSASDPTQNGRLSRGLTASSCGAPKTAPGLGDAAHTRFYDVFRHTNESDGTLCTLVSIEYPNNCSADRPFSAAYLPSFDPATSVRTNYLADGASNGVHGERTIRYSFGVPAGSPYDVVVTTFAAGATCPGYDLRFGTASPYPTGAPTVNGTAQAGETLTATDGTWTGAPSSFAYQWQRCFGDGSGCGNIPGATSKTLALTDRNVGDTFRVRVTAMEGIGSASKLSAVSAAVAEAPPGPPPPQPPPGPPAYAGIALKPLTKVVGKKGSFTLSLACPAEAVGGCVGTDVVKVGKASLGSKAFSAAPGKATTVSFKLSKALRKRLAKRKKLAASQVVNSSDVRGSAVRTSSTLTLKAKRKG
jgi:Ig domain of plant-specific actin-binding protein